MTPTRGGNGRGGRTTMATLLLVYIRFQTVVLFAAGSVRRTLPVLASPPHALSQQLSFFLFFWGGGVSRSRGRRSGGRSAPTHVEPVG